MKFYQGLLPRKIWDPVKAATIVDFGQAGCLETSDTKIIKLLKAKGYPTEQDMFYYERTGTLPHGGFAKRDMDSEYPSGRPAIEDPDSVIANAPKAPTNTRRRAMKPIPEYVPDDTEDVVIKRPRKTKKVAKKK